MQFIKLVLLGAIAVLPACGNQNATKGVGFTGIGNEAGYSSAQPSNEYTPYSTPYTRTASVSPAGTALHRNTSASQKFRNSSLRQKAETAIRKGSGLKRSSTSITLNGKERRLSRVNVGGTEFAVLKIPSEKLLAFSMNRKDMEAFNQQASKLTGCAKGDGVFGYGASRNSFDGLAAVISCS